MFLRFSALGLVALVTTVGEARGQEAVSSINQSRLFAVPTAPGVASSAAIENGTNNGTETSAGDDSFGAQLILKDNHRSKTVAVFGDASEFYTTNVDVRPDKTRSDVFVAGNFGAAWRPTLSPTVIGEIAVTNSVFRYDRASELDFERISVGGGLTWAVPRTPGILAFLRYDFTELLDSDGGELLRDHAFTLGAQKTFVLGRSHFLTTGITGIGGISTPESQQRQQVGGYATYHLQITRCASADLLYRYAAQFYADDGRIDHNQTISLSIGLAATRWMRVSATLSAARNDSNRRVFEYDVLNVGEGVQLGIKF